jgi:hypothetical protein
MTAHVPQCPTCGAARQDGATECAYCHSSPNRDGATPPVPTRSVEAAVTAWGRTIFGAPRHLGRLIRSVKVEDEVLQRLYTTIVRRDVQEVRGRGPSGRRTPARMHSTSVDPFAVSPEQLREASQHVTTCDLCGGSGTSVCRGCGGGGRAKCNNCHGSGQERRHYKKSSRMVKCTVCRGGGTVACGDCSARGTVGCDGCGATGNQSAWLTYRQSDRAMLFVTDSPVVLGHRQLNEQRKLLPSDLSAFGVVANLEGQQLPEGGVVPAALLHSHAIDPRLERITCQQYVRMAVVRRDAEFEMCGAIGTLVLSGSELAGSTSPSAMRPVRIRRVLWGLGFVGFLSVSLAALGARPALPYFARTNEYVGMLIGVALLLSIPSLGIALRQLRNGFKFAGFATFERALLAGTIVCSVGALAVGKLVRPHITEVDDAVAAKDTGRARIVLDALTATGSGEADILEAQDRVELTEAAAQPLEARLHLLDAIASGRRTRADQAARMARTDRLKALSGELEAHTPAAAVAAIIRWFPNGADPEVSELLARAEQQLFASCTDLACRFAAARRTNTAATNPERAGQAADAKHALLAALQFAQIPNESVPARLVRLRELERRGVAAGSTIQDDADIADAATKAIALARNERSHVALVGAQEAAVAELLGPLIMKTDAISYLDLAGYRVSAVFDRQRRCRGVYIVGTQAKARTIEEGLAEAALSQAVGRSAVLKQPPSIGAGTSRWIENGMSIVARWSQRALVEIRIGDAAP